MKGLELPISMIVVIAIAVLVLVIVAAFFTNIFGGTVNDINLDSAIQSACSNLQFTYNCNIDRWNEVYSMYKAPGKDEEQRTSLEELCDLKGMDIKACAGKCGCPIPNI
ncbi:MAG: hypothetical protein V1802_02355 [Candidatus Aenigmatarchaeota archaeon]